MIRVPGPSSPLEGRSAKVIAVIVIGVLVAIIKPWGTISPGPASRPSSSAPESVEYRPQPSLPTVAELRPGGLRDRTSPTPAGSSGRPATSSRSGSRSRIDTARPPDAVRRIGRRRRHRAAGSAAAHADPLEARPTAGRPSGRPPSLLVGQPPVAAGDQHAARLLGRRRSPVLRLDPETASRKSPIVRPPSPWPDHFTIVGVDQGERAGCASRAGRPASYRLVMRFSPGPIDRSVDIRSSRRR